MMMNRFTWLVHTRWISSILLMGGLAAGLLLPNSPALAAKSFKVGIIDPKAVIERSKAGKRALAMLKEHGEIRQRLLANDEKELKKLEAEIRAASDPNAPEVKEKQELFRKKLQEYQKRVQEFQQEMAEKQNDMVKEYMRKIEVATKAVAERHGFSLIIDKGSDALLRIVLYSRKGLDITNEVVKEFDRRYK
ncbi:MAG: OmpH family outer membrane protein [Nitrospirae bacterium]|nr:MAG: OmpH family outer membrane protein [Nitrospirota bacterium]